MGRAWPGNEGRGSPWQHGLGLRIVHREETFMRRQRWHWIVVVPMLLAPAKMSLATVTELEAIVEYYRKKAQLSPETSLSVAEWRDAPIDGLKEGFLDVGVGPRLRRIPFTSSKDGRYVVFAAFEDSLKEPARILRESSCGPEFVR